jgi:hypothetical protein
MNNLPLYAASDLRQYIIEATHEKVVLLFPVGDSMLLDINQIGETFEDVSSVTEDILENFQQRITIEFKQNRLSCDGKYMLYK